MPEPVALGLGLIRIGKPWGFLNSTVPDPDQSALLLDTALDLGITIFDTAASYGTSEALLGKWLAALSGSIREHLTVATKFGEHWDSTKAEPYVDHSFDALRRSLDTSLRTLGRIDLLQLHKTTPSVLRSPDLSHALEYTRSCGVERFGASVADLESAEIAIKCGLFSMLQLPFHGTNRNFLPVIEKATAAEMTIWVNRPFNMGRALFDGQVNSAETREACFRAILTVPFRGVVLTGTGSAEHLKENHAAFLAAQSSYGASSDTGL